MLLRKQIFQSNILKKLLTEEHSCVTLVPTTRILSLPPCFMNETKKGIFFILNKALKKYDQHLDGILIGYQNVKILMDERTGLIPMGVADTRVNVSIEFYVFQPKIGGLLQGVVNKKSNSHIGCLVHKYFNASILKPDEIEYEDWDCKDIDVDDHIKFRVTDLDFTGFVPRIEGTISREDSEDGLSIAQINNNLIANNLPNPDNYEKELLGSDEFWSKKLSKSNWVPELNTQDFQQKSREITYSSNESLGDDTNPEINHGPLHKKKKKRKDKNSHKMSYFKPLSKGEDEDNNRGENDSLHFMTDETDNREKVSDESANEEASSGDNREIKQDKIKTPTPKKSPQNSTSPIKNSKKATPCGGEGKSNVRQTPETNIPDFSTSNTASERRKKRKRETLDGETTPKSSPNVSKIAGRSQEKQSESDSGVGLEPKEAPRSPVLYRPPRKKQKQENSEKESGSPRAGLPELDTTELQMSLLRDVMNQLKERGTSPRGRKKSSRSEKKAQEESNQTKERERSPAAGKTSDKETPNKRSQPEDRTKGNGSSEKTSPEDPNSVNELQEMGESSTTEKTPCLLDKKAPEKPSVTGQLNQRGKNSTADKMSSSSEKKTPRKPNAMEHPKNGGTSPSRRKTSVCSDTDAEKKAPKDSNAMNRLKERATNPTARKRSTRSDKNLAEKANSMDHMEERGISPAPSHKKAPEKSNGAGSTEGDDLIESLRMQMLMMINGDGEEGEENLFKTPKKMKNKRGEREKRGKPQVEDTRTESDRLERQPNDVGHEDLLERLKRENIKFLQGGRDRRSSKPKKEKKTKEKKANKKEKTKEKRAKKEEKTSIVDEGDFSTLYTKLLNYAMSNVNGGQVDEEDLIEEKETKKANKSKRKREDSCEEDEGGDRKRWKGEKKHRRKGTDLDGRHSPASLSSFSGDKLRKKKKKKKDKKRKREKSDKGKRTT